MFFPFFPLKLQSKFHPVFMTKRSDFSFLVPELREKAGSGVSGQSHG
jgi:hypothetical protein